MCMTWLCQSYASGIRQREFSFRYTQELFGRLGIKYISRRRRRRRKQQKSHFNEGKKKKKNLLFIYLSFTMREYILSCLLLNTIVSKISPHDNPWPKLSVRIPLRTLPSTGVTPTTRPPVYLTWSLFYEPKREGKSCFIPVTRWWTAEWCRDLCPLFSLSAPMLTQAFGWPTEH